MVAETNGEIRKAVDELYVLSSSKEVRAEYERRQRALIDYNTHMEDHFLAGKKEGRREERSNIIELLKKGYSLEELEKFLSQD